MVKDVTHILESKQTSIGRSTCPVHDGVGPGLDGSVPPHSRILVLVVGFRLKISDVVGPEDVLDLVGDLIFERITDELVHSTMSTNIVFQSIDKLLPRPHRVDIRDQRLFTSQKLYLFNTAVHSRGVRVDCACCNCLMSPWDIEGWVSGLEVPFHVVGANRNSPLGSILKGIPDSVCVHPSKIRLVFVIIKVL